jgi:signal transduction histidine kinase/ActR/RegA family two-component response regulator
MTETQRWERRLERERKARKEAERLLEEKSRELFRANEDLKSEIKSRESVIQERTSALNEALEKAEEASRSKSNFLSVVSHEMRTPLNAIIGMADLLSDTGLDDKQRELQNHISKSGEALLTLINQLLDIARIEAGQIELFTAPADLREAAEEVIALLGMAAKRKGLRIETNLAPTLAPAYEVDIGRLKQILLNLVSNAVKFTEGGSVTITISASREDDQSDLVRFEVRDTGIGLNDEIMGKLFQPFSQADSTRSRPQEGTGLGLAISQQLVERMGGKIHVDRIEPSGSRFWFDLHLPTAGRSATAAPARQGLEVSGEKLDLKVLVADDNASNRQLATAFLSKLGCGVTAVENGAKALEAVKDGDFDAVLMDIQMPVMDGIAATRAIRALPGPKAKVAIIALTANVMPADDEKYLAAGIQAVLGKPMRIWELEESLKSALVSPG